MHRKTPADRAPPKKYPIPAYTNAYSGPENAGNPKGSTEFFSKIGKYLGFKSDLETASYCCIIPRRPLKMLFYTLLEKLCTEKKKKGSKWSTECGIKQAETTEKKVSWKLQI